MQVVMILQDREFRDVICLHTVATIQLVVKIRVL